MTQNDIVLKHLKRKSITPIEAINKYGITRLGARIWDLKQAGFKIKRQMVEVASRNGTAVVARYSLG